MEKRISSEILHSYPRYDKRKVDDLLAAEVDADTRKIIVLDDDPTGIQTVHDLSVYTDWSLESIGRGFEEKNKLFFILTNSRGFTAEQTAKAHEEIGKRADRTAKEMGREYLIVSRGDSTLRGHYPLETEVLKAVLEEQNPWKVDGEILCPFFAEGGRFTIDNVHYVKYGDELVPAGETEFAGDKTFGYQSSNLSEYIEEKTEGRFRADSVVCVSLEDLRGMKLDKITEQLLAVKGFQKIIVNAVDEYDIKVFCIALYRAMGKGKHYIFRTAAAFVKAFGNISDKPLLTKDEMITEAGRTAGIVVIGSHTEKTTMQLEELKKTAGLQFVEMDSDLVLVAGGLEREAKRIRTVCENAVREGKTVVVYTKRRLLSIENDTKEAALLRSLKISEAVMSLVEKLEVTPAFIIAKGGITSSDIGTKALRVKRAQVLGQIRPGVPVWRIGEESKFPGLPYVIFPGNVGEVTTLREAVELLMIQRKDSL